ncbi:MAG: sensor histidine kinase, partial [Paracoccaceae bacterium]
VVAMAVQEHRGRTGSDVDLASDCDCKPALAPAERICLYRFVQEGLNNAHRHASGVGLAVALHCQPGQISVSVMDRGPGFGRNDPQQQFGLGLSGLRDRVEAIGGNFGVGNRSGGGAEVKMSLETGA